MRVEYNVSEDRKGWRVQRGLTEPLTFATFEAAVRAAQHLAQSASDNGDTGVVKIVGGTTEAIFKPHIPHTPATAFDPERDGRERAERLAPMRY